MSTRSGFAGRWRDRCRSPDRSTWTDSPEERHHRQNRMLRLPAGIRLCASARSTVAVPKCASGPVSLVKCNPIAKERILCARSSLQGAGYPVPQIRGEWNPLRGETVGTRQECPKRGHHGSGQPTVTSRTVLEIARRKTGQLPGRPLDSGRSPNTLRCARPCDGRAEDMFGGVTRSDAIAVRHCRCRLARTGPSRNRSRKGLGCPFFVGKSDHPREPRKAPVPRSGRTL